MEISKKLLKEANIIPKLRLAVQKPGGGVIGTGPHRVRLLKDKLVDGTTFEGKAIQKVRLLVEENGEKKIYEVPKDAKSGDLHYLVQRLAELNEGDEVILEYKRRGPKGYIAVMPVVGGKAQEEVEMEDDEVDTTGDPIVDALADVHKDDTEPTDPTVIE